MRTEKEIRQMLEHYVEEYEGGHDPFTFEQWAPQDEYCLWCARLRVLHWVLGDLDSPDNESGVQEGWMNGWASAVNELTMLRRAMHVKD